MEGALCRPGVGEGGWEETVRWGICPREGIYNVFACSNSRILASALGHTNG